MRRDLDSAADVGVLAVSDLIYLASPYSHTDRAVVEARFDAVCVEAAILMAAGHHIFSPIAHTHPIAMRGELPTDWTFWQQYDTAMIRACSALWVLMLDGWDTSKGVAAEMAIATELGIPVIYIEPRRP